MEFIRKRCVPCEGMAKPMSRQHASRYIKHAPGWKLERKEISRDFVFKDFNGSMKFVNAVAKVAEKEGHHPDICIFWNKVSLRLSTHSIGGLSENDFIVAAKISKLNEVRAANH